MICSVCLMESKATTVKTIPHHYIEAFGWCHDPAATYVVELCNECKATDDNPDRLIDRAYEEWREWYIHAAALSIDEPILPD